VSIQAGLLLAALLNGGGGGGRAEGKRADGDGADSDGHGGGGVRSLFSDVFSGSFGKDEKRRSRRA
jgi:hypothetical protein